MGAIRRAVVNLPVAGKAWLALGSVALVAALVLMPSGFGLSSGAMKDTIQDPNFGVKGCTACHGGDTFAAGGSELISWTIQDADGVALSGNTYAAETAYTITITLDEQNEPAAPSRAGFNLRTTAGKLEGVEGQSQGSTDGLEATHIGSGRASWAMTWTSPADDTVVVFDLFVNDVDGSGAPDAADQVHRVGFWLTNSHGDTAGAAKEEHIEFGISLQQYWIGLIGLAGMLFIMVGGYVYLKYGNPHNTDEKDR